MPLASLGLDRLDIFIAIAVFLITVIALRLTKNQVSTQGFQEVASSMNTKGGNVLVLAVMSMFFFVATMWLAFVVIQDIKAGTLREDNAIALMALQFCMNSAFSACLGAMLKTMTGESPSTPSGTSMTKIVTETKSALESELNATATNTLTASGTTQTHTDS